MSPPRRLVLLLTAATIALHYVQSLTIDPHHPSIEACCNYGRTHKSQKSCNNLQYNYTKVSSRLQIACYHRMIDCCNQQRDIDSCKAGRDSATANKPCLSANKKFSACCRECENGMEMARRGSECKVQGGDPLEAMSRSQCCRDSMLNSEEDRSGETDSYESSDDDDDDEDDNFIMSRTGRRNHQEPCGDSHYCDHNCIIVGGRQRCTCNSGFELQRDGRSCKSTQPGPTRVIKTCTSGFYLSAFGICEDINECEIVNNGCGANADCHNRIGFYECQPRDVCASGFRFNSKARACEDINECAEFRHICKNDQHCNNTIGGFFCSDKCPDLECNVRPEEDFTMRPPTTRRTFPPRPPRPIATTRHSKGANPTYPIPQYFSSTTRTPRTTTTEFSIFGEGCRSGFKRNSRGLCVDVDECSSNPCPSHLRCVNYNGGFNCEVSRCKLGERLINNTECVKIDFCRENPCARGYDCTNLQDRRVCRMKSCERGFRRHTNGDCVDVNECELAGMCPHGVCLNTPGSFECRCRDGFKKDASGRCADIDECLESNPCDQKCYNTFGSFRCYCSHGYKLSSYDNRTCEDINECKEHGDNLCYGECRNLDGSYECLCPAGFRRDGIYCSDVNECEEEANLCGYDDESECLNLAGGYRCMRRECPSGYKLVHDFDHKYCRMMMPCGYKNDDESCAEPWLVGQSFLARTANCTEDRLMEFLLKTSIHIETEIGDVRVTSAGENVKQATRDDFSVNISEKGYILAQNRQLNGPQEIEVDITIKYFKSPNELHYTRRQTVFIVVSEYPFHKFSDKLIQYQTHYCPNGCDK